MATYMIEGEWSGYAPSHRRVVHREYTTSKQRAEAIKKLGCITYGDGTRLILTVNISPRGNRPPPINGYNSLISDCLKYGMDSVGDLGKRKVKREGSIV